MALDINDNIEIAIDRALKELLAQDTIDVVKLKNIVSAFHSWGAEADTYGDVIILDNIPDE